MLPRAGIGPASPRLLVGRDDHYTIGATTLATWPLWSSCPTSNRGDAGSIPARGNMFFFSHEVCVESQTAQLFTVRYLFVFKSIVALTCSVIKTILVNEHHITSE